MIPATVSASVCTSLRSPPCQPVPSYSSADTSSRIQGRTRPPDLDEGAFLMSAAARLHHESTINFTSHGGAFSQHLHNKNGNTKMFIRTLSVLLAVSTMVATRSANAQFVQEHIISVESSTPASAREFLQGNKGSPIQLAGKLRLARPGPRQPVVVIFPGAGGIGAARHTSNEWARVFNESGISAFIVDSFTPRKKYQITEHATLPPIVRVLDAFAVLKALSDHPLIDGSKISIIGFSHGSSAAMYSNLARFQKLYGNGLKFAAHISNYGLCAIKYLGDEETISPMLILHGSADDWVPAAPCVEYVDRLRKTGRDVRLITYPDAHHVFDSASVGKLRTLEFATSAACRLEETVSGELISRDTGKPLMQEDACRKKGVSLGYNESAAKKAHSDVIAFLKSVIGE